MKKKCLIIFSAVIVILVVSILLVLFLKKDEKKLIDNEPSGSKIDNTNPNNDEPNNDSDVCGVVFGSLSENAFFSKNDAGKYVFCKNNKKTENVYDKIKNIIHTTDDKDCSGCLYCDNYPWYNNSKYAIVELNNKVGVVDEIGNYIVPLEYENNDTSDYANGEIYKNGDKYYFLLYKNNKNYLLDESNKVVLENSSIKYNSALSYLYTVNGNTYNFYSTNGKTFKTLNKDYISNSRIITYPQGCRDYMLKEISNGNLYYTNRDFKTIKLTNLFYSNNNGENAYYLNNKAYIAKENNEFIFKSISNNSIINKYKTLTAYDKIFHVCKDKSSNCGLVDIEGKELTNFTYGLNQEIEYNGTTYSNK